MNVDPNLDMPDTREKVGIRPLPPAASSEAFFRDANGDPCEREEASSVEIHELNGAGEIIARTYMVLGRKPRPAANRWTPFRPVLNADGVPLRDPDTGAVVGSGGNCGTGAGGFKKGNTCAAGGSGARRSGVRRGRSGNMGWVQERIRLLGERPGEFTSVDRAELVDALFDLTVPQLKTLLREAGGRPTGRKAALVVALGKELERLLAAHRTREPYAASSPAADRAEPEGVRLRFVGPKAEGYLKTLFRDKLPSADALGAMVCAPDGATLHVSPFDGTDLEKGVKVEWDERGANARSLLYVDLHGKRWCTKSYFEIGDDSPYKGMGVLFVRRAVESLRAAGFDRINLYAAGEPGDPKYNGYYTWPRFGYNAPLWAKIRERPGYASFVAASGGKEPATILDILDRPGGAKWWKENGGPTSMVFNLAPNSRSSRTLEAYLAERAVRDLAASRPKS